MNKLWIAASMLLFVACEKTETPATAPDVAPASPPAAPVNTAPAVPEVDLERLAVEEDFEQEAETEITADTLVAKLDEIEKEIGAE